MVVGGLSCLGHVFVEVQSRCVCRGDGGNALMPQRAAHTVDPVTAAIASVPPPVKSRSGKVFGVVVFFYFVNCPKGKFGSHPPPPPTPPQES